MAQYDLVLTQNVAATGSEFTERAVTMAKGTLISANGSSVPTSLPAGTNGYILSRDDAEATGLKWIAAPAAGVTPADSPILDWDAANSYYNAYAVGDKAAGRFYYGATTPTGTTRLNYDGYIYASKLYAGASEVLVASGTPVDNQVAVWLNATTLDGSTSLTFDGTTFTVATAVLISLAAGASNYAITFGDGDTNIYESTDDQLMIRLAATNRWRATATQFRMDGNGGPSLQQVNSSATVPVFCNINSDSTTGIGGAASTVNMIVASTAILTASSTSVASSVYFSQTGAVDLRIGTAKAIYYDSTSYNVRIGGFAGNDSMSQSISHILIGYQAGLSITTNNGCVFIGANAGSGCTSGTYNTGVGGRTLQYVDTGSQNMALGFAALRYSVGTANTAIGYGAGQGVSSQTNGTYNTFVGNASGYAHTTGSYNAAVGYGSFTEGTGIGQNAALGAYAGRYNYGSSNVFVGYLSGGGVTGGTATGAYNTFVGYQTGDSLTSGQYNILIGYNVDLTAATTSYQFRLGSGTKYLLEGDMTGASEWVGTSWPLRVENYVRLLDITAPGTPASGYGYVYVNSDKLYFKNDAGTAFDLTANTTPPADNIYDWDGTKYLRYTSKAAAVAAYNDTAWWQTTIQNGDLPSNYATYAISGIPLAAKEFFAVGGTYQTNVERGMYMVTSAEFANSTGHTVALPCFLRPYNTDNTSYKFGTADAMTAGSAVVVYNASTLLFEINYLGAIIIKEISAPSTYGTGYGTLYIDSADSKLKFRNDGSTVYDLCAAGGGVSISGTPANDQVAIWTSSTAIEGTTALTFNGSLLTSSGGFLGGVTADSVAINTNAVHITVSSTVYMSLQPNVADGATAVAYRFNTVNSLANASARLISVTNQGAERFYVSSAGIAVVRGVEPTLMVSDGTYSMTFYVDSDSHVGLISNSTGDINVVSSAKIDLQSQTGIDLDLISTGFTSSTEALMESQNGYETTPASFTIRGGRVLGVTGNYNGGNIRIYGGSGLGTGTRGNIYFGSGSAGYLPAKGSETNVVYYDTTTGKLSYGTVSGGVTINSNVDTYLLTATGTANTIDGEQYLKWTSGTYLDIGTNGRIRFAAGNHHEIYIDTETSSANGYNLDITGSQAGVSGYTGGKVTVKGGTGSGSGAGGNIFIISGSGGASGVSGNVYIHPSATGGSVGNTLIAYDGTTARGYVGIRGAHNASYALYVTGAIYATGDITGNSDIREKVVFGTIENSLANLMQVKVIKFAKHESLERVRYGFSAQELHAMYPEIGTYDKPWDRYGVCLMGVSAWNTAAIQELKKEKDEEIKDLRKRVKDLEHKVEMLEISQ